jgi:uracil-DNA glycosylase
MTGPVITCPPNLSSILMVGQAPGEREGQYGRPFAWTAGKTLFGWYRQIGVDEDTFRKHVYIAAVCRCFPGKNPSGGDRVPGREEIERCAAWLAEEVKLLQPGLLIPVGKLAIGQFMPVKLLKDVIGGQYLIDIGGRAVDVIPLPHPSGLSPWHRVEPGKGLLQDALQLIRQHVEWQRMFAAS